MTRCTGKPRQRPFGRDSGGCLRACAQARTTNGGGLDIDEAARIFVDRYGLAAPVEAQRRVEELRRAGSLRSSATWLAIYEAVNALIEDERDRE